MSISNIKLEKIVFKNKSTYDSIDTSFSDLIKTKKPANIKTIILQSRLEIVLLLAEKKSIEAYK